MAEPFVFHYRRGDGGRPEQMYLADIQAECAVCGHLQVQRYYHSAELHNVTVAALRRLADAVREKTDFECPNCGSAVGSAQALSTAFTWGFPDDAGLVRAFYPIARDPSSLRWQLVPRHRLDPQELPGWAPDPARQSSATLTEDWLEDELGRVVSLKGAIRDVLHDWLADPRGGAIAAIDRGMLLVAAGPDASLDELAAEASIDTDWLAVDLNDCVPTDVPTHSDPEQMHGRLQGWLPDGVSLEQVRIHVDPAAAVAGVSRAFDVANLSYEWNGEVFDSITTPREAVFPRSLPLLAMIRRAVYTGLTPGDAARLTAEEIVGSLLRVW